MSTSGRRFWGRFQEEGHGWGRCVLGGLTEQVEGALVVGDHDVGL